MSLQAGSVFGQKYFCDVGMQKNVEVLSLEGSPEEGLCGAEAAPVLGRRLWPHESDVGVSVDVRHRIAEKLDRILSTETALFNFRAKIGGDFDNGMECTLRLVRMPFGYFFLWKKKIS